MVMTELVNKACTGDKEALIALVMERKDEYYRLAYTYMMNEHDSLDAMQDMIVLLYNNIRKLKNPDAFYSWSKSILVNCCRSILRRKKKTIPQEHDADVQYIENYQTSEQRIDIIEYIKKLNRHQQEALKLKYFLGLDYQSIAAMTRVPLGTVKSRISEGLKKLRDAIGGEY